MSQPVSRPGQSEPHSSLRWQRGTSLRQALAFLRVSPAAEPRFSDAPLPTVDPGLWTSRQVSVSCVKTRTSRRYRSLR